MLSEDRLFRSPGLFLTFSHYTANMKTSLQVRITAICLLWQTAMESSESCFPLKMESLY